LSNRIEVVILPVDPPADLCHIVTLVVRRVRSLTISFPLACAHPSTVINTDTIFFDGSPVIFDGLMMVACNGRRSGRLSH
jgi:hypothetical protein